MPCKTLASAFNLRPEPPSRGRGSRALGRSARLLASRPARLLARRLAAASILAFGIAAPAAAMGQRIDSFVPADKAIEEKRYEDALKMLRDLSAADPSLARDAQNRVNKVLLLMADRDIDNQRYNEAAAALHDFMIANPLRFDEAQERVRRINQKREEYTKKANELLAYMKDPDSRADPDYNAEVTKKVADLDALDRNNPEAKQTITSLKETSLALINQDEMKSIMTAARSLIDSSLYVEAERKYQEGFELFKPEFEAAGYDAITVAAVAKLVERAKSAASAYEAAQAEFASANAAMGSALDQGDPAAAAAALPRTLAAYQVLDSLRAALDEAGSGLARWYETIPKEGKSIIEYQYLAYVDLFVRGRPDDMTAERKSESEKGLPEGMVGALMTQRAAALTRLQASASARLDEYYARGEKAFDERSWTTAEAAFGRAAALAAPATAILGLWARSDPEAFVPDAEDYVRSVALAAALEARLSHAGKAAAAFARLSVLAAEAQRVAQRVADFEAGRAPIAPLAELGAWKAEIGSALTRLDESLERAAGEEPPLREEAAAAVVAAQAVPPEKAKREESIVQAIWIPEGYALGRPTIEVEEEKAEVLPAGYESPARQGTYRSRLAAVAAWARNSEIGAARARVLAYASNGAAIEAEALDFESKRAAAASLEETATTLAALRARLDPVIEALGEEKLGESALASRSAAAESALSEAGGTAAAATALFEGPALTAGASDVSRRIALAAAQSRRAELRLASANLASLAAKSAAIETEAASYGSGPAATAALDQVRSTRAGLGSRLSAIEAGLDAAVAGESGLRGRISAAAAAAAAYPAQGPDPTELAADYSRRLAQAVASSRRAEVGIASIGSASLAAKTAAVVAEAQAYEASQSAQAASEAVRAAVAGFRSRLAALDASLGEERSAVPALVARARVAIVPDLEGAGDPAALATAHGEALVAIAVAARRAEARIALASLASHEAKTAAIESEATTFASSAAPAATLERVRATLEGYSARLAAIESALDEEKAGEAALALSAAAAVRDAERTGGAALDALADSRPDALVAAYSARLAAAIGASRRAEIGIAAANLSSLAAKSAAIEAEAAAYAAGAAATDPLDVAQRAIAGLGTRLGAVAAALETARAGEAALAARVASYASAAGTAYSASLKSAIAASRKAEVGIAAASLSSLEAKAVAIERDAAGYETGAGARDSLEAVERTQSGFSERLAAVESALEGLRAGERLLVQRAAAASAELPSSAPALARPDIAAAAYSARLTSAYAVARRVEARIASVGLASLEAKALAVEKEAADYEAALAALASIDSVKRAQDGYRASLASIEAALDAAKAGEKALADRAAAAVAALPASFEAIARPDAVVAAYAARLTAAIAVTRRVEVLIASVALTSFAAKSAALEREIADYEAASAAAATLEEVRAALAGFASRLTAIDAGLELERSAERSLVERARAAAATLAAAPSGAAPTGATGAASVAAQAAAARASAAYRGERPDARAAAYSSRLAEALGSARRAEVLIASANLASLAAKAAAVEREAADYEARGAVRAGYEAARAAMEPLTARLAAVDAALAQARSGEKALADRAAAASAAAASAAGQAVQPRDLAAAYSARASAAAATARRAEVAIASARLASLAANALSLASEAAAYDARTAPTESVAAVRAELERYRSRIASLAASLAAERAGEPALAARALAASASLTDGRPDVPEIAYRGRLAAAATAVRRNEIAVIALRAGRDAAVVAREYSSRDSAVKKAQGLIDGVASTIAERAKAGYLDPYPSEASVLLAAEEKGIADLQALARATLAAFAAEAADVRADASFEAARAAVDAALRGAETLQRTRAAALARAAERRQVAEAAIRAASALLAESRRLLVAADPTKAKPTVVRQNLAESKSKLEDAFKKILESANADFVLSRWEDYRSQYDQLNADLAQAKKDFVVAETFRLLTEGQRYFDQTLYEQAGEVLADAQAIWAEENDEDQPQVKYWLSLVKMASDTTNKREVRPSDALYYDISNYLSEARKQYTRGDTLMKAGRKTEAMQAFEAAKLSIKFITRAFPLNAEAGFLLLQIQKSTDPAAFSIRLPDEIQNARKMLDTNPQEGYSRIADLVRLEPTNATLKNLIIQAEIRVGKRNPPPTAAQIAQAASLIAQAATLLKTGRTADLDRAETLLNQATRLDPNNKNATPLLKDINTIKGKTKGPALGLADQAVLDQATRAYAASQYNQSRDLLNQLLADAAKKTREVLKLDADLRQLGY